jgi:hypothetical protein
MITTTLRTGVLTLASAQYSIDQNYNLTIKLTASSAHKLYGSVNITLANVNLGVNGKEEGFLNDTLSFTRTGTSTLEYTTKISNINAQIGLTTLPNNGSAITATVANSSFDLAAGTYNFLLLDTADSVFSTSAISIKQLNLGGIGVDGVESLFYEEDDFTVDPKQFSINNVDLTFKFPARVSINADVSGTTNIPLIIS